MNINYSCGPLDKPQVQNWSSEETETSVLYYPSGEDNSITFSFSNISASKFDVCINLEYKSNQTVYLDVNYTFENDKVSINDKLFTIPLDKPNEEKENLKFCVRDFLYTVHEQFSLSLKISGIEENNWNNYTFLLINFTPSVKRIPPEIPFIDRWGKWDDSPDGTQSLIQYWSAIPNKLFTIQGSFPDIPLVYTFRSK